MKNMDRYIDGISQTLFRLVVWGVLCFLIIGFLSFPSERQKELYNCEILDANWYRIMEDGSITSITLPGEYEVEKGEKFTVRGTIPETLDVVAAPWLCFHSSLQDMEIRIDGKVRGVYTTKSTRLWGKNSVSGYYFVRLEPSDPGKTIEYSTITDSKYTGVVREVQCGTVFGINMYFAKSNAFEVIGALLVMLLSVMTIIISECIKLKMHKQLYLGYLGWTELILSIWILSESPMRQLYYQNISLAGYMTHFMVYLLAVPVLLFFDYVQMRRYKTAYRILFYVELLYAVAASALEIAGYVDFSVLFSISVGLHFMGVICVVAAFILDMKQGYTKKYRLVCWGFVGFVVSNVSQLLMYQQKSVVFHGGFLCIGAIFWLVMTAISTLRDYFELERENVENRLKTEKLTWQAMTTLVQTIEAKDAYTKGHSTRVARYAALLAEKLGMSREQQNEIYYMGMLHDIGKIGIADTIINKPGKLTDEEYAVVKTHPDIGYQILKNMNEIKDIEYGARWHHERYDGKGYPDGLFGEEIPIYARIIAVADVYDAMTSNRSYRKVMEQSRVRAEIERVRGSQLDPDIAACMLQLIDEDPEYKLRQEEAAC